jgi:hypothetical protein
MNRLHTYPITNKANKMELNVIETHYATTNTTQTKLRNTIAHTNRMQTPIHNIRKQNGLRSRIMVKKQGRLQNFSKKHK